MRIGFGLLVAALGLAISTPAFGQATRTWVSGVGDDVNPCSRTAPCKTFAGAISKTATNGEISVLDPGGFGAINITKSITIDGGGIIGSILALNVNGVIVNCAGCTVNLRNLAINGGGGTTGNGVRIVNAGNVNLVNVSISNFAGNTTNGRGIVIDTSAANVRVSLNNVDIYNVGFVGIHSNPTGGNVLLSVSNTRVQRTTFSAIQLRQLTTAAIDHATLTDSGSAGVTLELTTAVAHVSNSLIANNVHGIFNGGGGNPTTRLFNNVITGNTTAGLTINSGSVLSYGNNAIRGNAGNEAPTGAATGTQ
ncbi:MAG TPA: right-handed parallel beta-helix repeat-containing protein [Allosphingosinicella sp.]|nr:right-handed parallel beta-helix repeat-containing protein [Allosphingosinicella sp.]